MTEIYLHNDCAPHVVVEVVEHRHSQRRFAALQVLVLGAAVDPLDADGQRLQTNSTGFLSLLQ